MGAGKGYNSAVECHLDMVEVISSSLIIPKPNVSPSIFFGQRYSSTYIIDPHISVSYTHLRAHET